MSELCTRSTPQRRGRMHAYAARLRRARERGRDPGEGEKIMERPAVVPCMHALTRRFSSSLDHGQNVVTEVTRALTIVNPGPRAWPRRLAAGPSTYTCMYKLQHVHNSIASRDRTFNEVLRSNSESSQSLTNSNTFIRIRRARDRFRARARSPSPGPGIAAREHRATNAIARAMRRIWCTHATVCH